MISLRYRGTYNGSAAIETELDGMCAQLRAWALISHNEDGTQRVSDDSLSQVPVGAMLDWATATAPRGWLICNGDAVNRVDYKGLFDLLGTTFGAGDGSTTFNLPDFRGRFTLSKAAAGTGSVIGATGGSLDHVHTGASHTHAAGTLAGPSHSHSVSGSTASDGAHTHTFADTTDAGDNQEAFGDTNGDGSIFEFSGSGHTHAVSGTTGSDGAHTHGVGTLATGSSGTGAVTGSTASDGAGATGGSNPAYIVSGNKIIFTGRV